MSVLSIDVGVLNLATCLATVESFPPSVLSCTRAPIGRPVDPIQTLVKNLVSLLDSDPESYLPAGLATVLVEQQMARSSPKNYAISAAILTYYRCRGVLDVRVVSPRSKFIKLEKRGWDRSPNLTCHKRASIDMVRRMADAHPDRFEPVSAALVRYADKLDDVCDCVLMCASWSPE